MSVLEYQRAPLAETEPDLPQPQGHWLLWAIYLAMSWTWCIGMFLPVLLVRDYGIWGWVVFAVPNVIGAAAMGWVIRSSHDSRALQQSHAAAVYLFALVTCTFQIFFACWILPWINIAHMNLAAGVLFVAVLVFATALTSWRAALWLGLVVLSISAMCLVETFNSPRLPNPSQLPRHIPLPVMLFAPVSIFGFALCPYLDPTFHHARQQLGSRNALLAFSFGFALIFAAVLIGVLAYARDVSRWLFASPRLSDAQPAQWLGTFLVVQLGFTVGLHWWRGTVLNERDQFLRGSLLVVLSIVLGIGTWTSTMLINRPWIEAGEIVYRAFMGFYGLAFPAYVWLCMIPSPRDQPSRRSLIVFAAAVLVAAPMFWLGFIEGRMIWLPPGLAIVLLARLLVPRRAVRRTSGGV